MFRLSARPVMAQYESALLAQNTTPLIFHYRVRRASGGSQGCQVFTDNLVLVFWLVLSDFSTILAV
jgi:hypothetical protein